MQPSTTSTKVRVTNTQGQHLDLSQIRLIQLPDGWHNLDEVELTYSGKSGGQKSVPFSDIRGFSDQDQNTAS